MKKRFVMRLKTARRARVLFLGRPLGVAADVDQAVEAFGQWCQKHEGAVCRLALSGRWLMQAVASLDVDEPALRQEALRQWSHYLDVDEAELSADWVYRQVRRPAVALACAAPRALVEGLMRKAGVHGVRLDAMQPWWVTPVQRWLEDAGRAELALPIRLSLVEPELLTHVEVLKLDGGHGPHVHAVWSEAVSGMEPPPMRGPVLRLPSLDEVGLGACGDATHEDLAQHDGEQMASLLWGHDALAKALCGAPDVWRIES